MREVIDFNNAREATWAMEEGDKRVEDSLMYAILEKEEFFESYSICEKSVLRILDDMNMRGAQLWAAYCFCGKDTSRLFACTRHREPAMVEYVNEVNHSFGRSEKAVIGGASQMQERPVFTKEDDLKYESIGLMK